MTFGNHVAEKYSTIIYSYKVKNIFFFAKYTFCPIFTFIRTEKKERQGMREAAEYEEEGSAVGCVRA